MKIVGWATNAKVGQILLKNYLENRISVKGFDDIGEPLFGIKEV